MRLTLVLLAAAVLALGGCGLPQKISESALRQAAANGTVAELRKLGYEVSVDCTLPPGNTLATVRVECRGRTSGGQPVRVDGVAYDADTSTPRQDYVISVAGRQVLRTPCLGVRTCTGGISPGSGH